MALTPTVGYYEYDTGENDLDTMDDIFAYRHYIQISVENTTLEAEIARLFTAIEDAEVQTEEAKSSATAVPPAKPAAITANAPPTFTEAPVPLTLPGTGIGFAVSDPCLNYELKMLDVYTPNDASYAEKKSYLGSLTQRQFDRLLSRYTPNVAHAYENFYYDGAATSTPNQGVFNATEGSRTVLFDINTFNPNQDRALQKGWIFQEEATTATPSTLLHITLRRLVAKYKQTRLQIEGTMVTTQTITPAYLFYVDFFRISRPGFVADKVNPEKYLAVFKIEDLIVRNEANLYVRFRAIQVGVLTPIAPPQGAFDAGYDHGYD